jgi:hypothetical protein
VHLVAVSDAQAAENPDVRYAAIVHNGIDVDAYTYRAHKDDYWSTSGARTPTRAPSRRSASRGRPAGPCKMILKRGEPPELRVLRARDPTVLVHDIEMFENVTHEDEGRPPRPGARDAVPDPVAGAVRARHGRGHGLRDAGRDDELGRGARARRRRVTGFRRDNADDPRARDRPRRQLDPAACRARVEERFSAAAMVRATDVLRRRAVVTAAVGFPLRT